MRPSIENLETMKLKAALCLRQGISPRRLALTLAIGFVLGCIPVVGIPTALCAMVALVFGLNQPAIQAANYLAMPFQLALLVPFVRLGGKLIPSASHAPLNLSALMHSPFQLLSHGSNQLAMQLAVMAEQAMLGWLLVAVPFVLLLTVMLTGVLRRVPAFA